MNHKDVLLIVNCESQQTELVVPFAQNFVVHPLLPSFPRKHRFGFPSPNSSLARVYQVVRCRNNYTRYGVLSERRFSESKGA